MNIRARLQLQILVIAAVTASILGVALVWWTIHDTRREIAATTRLVQTTVGLVLQAQQPPAGAGSAHGGAPTAAGPGGTLPGAAVSAPDPRAEDSALRHVRLALAGREPPGEAMPAGWLDRWLGTSVERIAIPSFLSGTPGAVRDAGATTELLVGANAGSELRENLEFAATALAGLLAFGIAVALLQYRTLIRAFNPVKTFRERLQAFEQGNLDARLPDPELEELSDIARSFNRLADSLQSTVLEQRRLSESLLSLRADERTRLARELHDDLGQGLTSLSVHLALLRQTEHDRDARALAVEALEADARNLQATTRNLLANLRDDRAEDEWVRLDPVSIVRQWQRSRPDVAWAIDPGWQEGLQGLRMPAYLAACRILQEALTNAFRHALPTSIVLQVAAQGESPAGRVLLRIENDGVPSDGGLPAGAGLGLKGMGERAAAIGARFAAGPLEGGRWQVALTMTGGIDDRDEEQGDG